MSGDVRRFNLRNRRKRLTAPMQRRATTILKHNMTMGLVMGEFQDAPSGGLQLQPRGDNQRRLVRLCVLPALGCTDPGACNYDPTAQFEDGSCDYIECLGCTDPSACNYDEAATIEGNCEYDSCAGCTDESASNYDPTATLDDDSCECVARYLKRCNFDANATVNDGSCDFESCLISGCTNELACNYDPDAVLFDNSCVFTGTACDDGDADTVDDVIGEDCMCAGVMAVEGCTDTSACNYDAMATSDDGSCEFLDAIGECGGECPSDKDADGICDDVDDCVGELDACGLCNGSGAVLECGCTNIPEGDCDWMATKLM